MPAATVIATSPHSGDDADQHRAGGAGEADMRQRVAGESLRRAAPGNSRPARDHRDDAGGGEGVAHEIVVKHACRAVVVLVRVALDVVAAGHHEDAPVRRDHVDRRSHRGATAPGR